MIMTCTCKHQAQDEFHGKGMRVFNVMKDGRARCTVCLAIRGDVKKKVDVKPEKKPEK